MEIPKEACSICQHKNALEIFNVPIKHWGCSYCGAIFVIDDSGIMGCLGRNFVYKGPTP